MIAVPAHPDHRRGFARKIVTHGHAIPIKSAEKRIAKAKQNVWFFACHRKAEQVEAAARPVQVGKHEILHASYYDFSSKRRNRLNQNEESL